MWVTVRRQPSTNQEEGPHQTLNMPVPCSWTSQSPELGEINLRCLPRWWYFCYSSRNRLSHYVPLVIWMGSKYSVCIQPASSLHVQIHSFPRVWPPCWEGLHQGQGLFLSTLCDCGCHSIGTHTHRCFTRDWILRTYSETSCPTRSPSFCDSIFVSSHWSHENYYQQLKKH